MDSHKIENLCPVKETVNQVKRQYTAWEKVFAIYTSDRGLESLHKSFKNKIPRKPVTQPKIGLEN